MHPTPHDPCGPPAHYEIRLSDGAALRLPHLAREMASEHDLDDEYPPQILTVRTPPVPGDLPNDRFACAKLVSLIHEDYGRRFGNPADFYDDVDQIRAFEDDLQRLTAADLVAHAVRCDAT